MAGVIIKIVENDTFEFSKIQKVSNNAVPPFRGFYSINAVNTHSILLRLLPCLHIFYKRPFLFNEK